MDEIFLKYIDNDYKEFNKKTVQADNILGIRSNDLRNIAKYYIQNNDYKILNMKLDYHEEYMVYMYMLSYIKDINLVYKKLDEIVPKINNWAICDSLMNIKIIRKNRIYFYNLIEKYRYSNNEFEIRFSLIMLFHYMDLSYIDKIFEILESVNSNAYYAKMGIAWVLCECFIKFRDYTIKKLNDIKIDNQSFNKAISKICDSFRVTKEDKDYLKTLRRYD